MRLLLPFTTLGVALALGSCGPAAAQTSPVPDTNAKHQSEQWKLIESHLPDPVRADAKTLEIQGDILRVRKFPEDAIAYYQYAINKGASAPHLFNKIGLAELELRNVTLARLYFQRAVKVSKKDAEAWNNLGAVEYLDGSLNTAISDYKKAAKYNRKQAVYHANLATAYFDRKDYGNARKEMAQALQLDPEVFEHHSSNGGVNAHVLSAQERARFSYEMAKMYARAGMEDEMLHSLAVALESGLDIQREMRKDPVLVKIADDPRILLLVKNAEALRASRTSGSAPPLPNAPVSE